TAHLPAVGPQRRMLQAQLKQVHEDRQTEELHHLAEVIRFRYGLAPPPAEEAQSLLRVGRRIWQARAVLLAQAGSPGDPDRPDRVRIDLLDLILIWADLRVRHAAASEIAEALREAVAALEQAK